MTVRPILKFPDPRLCIVAEPVIHFANDLHNLAADLLDTMRAAPGIGITAPHIGVPKRLVVLELSANDDVRIYVNPEIIWSSPDMVRHREGSVSMPGISEEVERHAHVRVRYRDLQGGEQIEEADGLLAICHQHEIDQLDGVFWLQKLSRLKRERLIRRYEKMQRGSPP